nr:MAG: hypothetical protein BECKH772A_GA0070896_1002526 [Candidatus Kentron sp. H]VFJ92144.1 MAG: hypothetical protein BECKH772B_GA0070898_1002525 [Candidatus Kentron sp. H]VFJ98742.1 MAG: hypothetical protein BECKH772C_GA0070978_1002426 [Candidatus Kentron sp. H]
MENLIAKTAAETRVEIIKWVSGLAVAQVFFTGRHSCKAAFLANRPDFRIRNKYGMLSLQR